MRIDEKTENHAIKLMQGGGHQIYGNQGRVKKKGELKYGWSCRIETYGCTEHEFVSL